MSIGDRFTKVYDELVAFGLPTRLILLYGKLAFHAGKDGRCYPTHETLAKEIGLISPTSHEHVLRLLRKLHQLGLIEWKRGRYSNAYWVLDPDPTKMSGLKSGQIRQTSRVRSDKNIVSDPTKMSDRKECLKDVRKESSSSQSENYVQLNDDDDPPKKSSQHQHPHPEAVAKLANPNQHQNQNPNSEARTRLIEEFRRMLRLSKAQTLRVPVEQVEAPDQAITIQILDVFADGADAQKWLEGTIRRGLARKSRSATWGLWLTDAQNHEMQIRLDREAEEKSRSDAETAREIARERERVAQAKAAAELDIPVPWLRAYGRIQLRIGEQGRDIPRPLKVRFRRTGELVSPNELARQVFDWQRCAECNDGGILGNAVDRDLRFCGCTAGIEAQYPPSDSERARPAEKRLHKGPDWPAEEIARVQRANQESAGSRSIPTKSAPAYGPLTRAAEAAPTAPERDQQGLCVKCGGPGVLADGAFCECSMGRDLEQLERRDKQAAKKGPLKEGPAPKILKFPKKGA